MVSSLIVVAMKSYRRTSSVLSSQSDLTCKFMIWLVKIYDSQNTNHFNFVLSGPTLRSSGTPGKSVSHVWSSTDEKSPISASVGDSCQG